jgi:aspartate-semialdehyde dehydrogenase
MKVGIIGWRGMVGSVLMERMLAERDLDGLDVHFRAPTWALARRS